MSLNIPRLFTKNPFHPTYLDASSSTRIVQAIAPRQTRSLSTTSLLSYRGHVRVGRYNQNLKLSEEVRAAAEAKQPIVALETAIYTHGFPYPDNVALASHLESVVRFNGGIPATIGVLHGCCRVGLQPEELIELAASAGKPETRKVSRRDLSYICGLGASGRKFNGGTTVSGTMVLADLAGIEIFATGGLGGVHRGGELSLDISADLTELGRTQVAVFSSGCKSFLDLPRTLEYLETQGVPVATFADGRNGEVDFPAFWTRESRIRSPTTITDEREAAHMIDAMIGIPVRTGLLFANPIPAKHSIEKAEMDAIISQAIQDADNAGSIGSGNTPFVLNRIREISNGRSVAANRALIESNVIRATKVAVIRSAIISKSREAAKKDRVAELSPRGAPERPPLDPMLSTRFSMLADDRRPCVIVAGSTAIDVSCDFAPEGLSVAETQPQLHTSNPSSIKQTVGGVGHNVASAIHHLGTRVILCSCVGDDLAGATIVASLAKRGFLTHGIRTIKGGSRTAQYTAINDARKSLVLAMADMKIMECRMDDFDKSWKHYLDTYKPRWLVIDTNWDSSTLHRWLRAGKASGVNVAVEPVSVAKSKRIFDRPAASDMIIGIVPDNTISLATPNALELRAMHEAASSSGLLEREDWFEVIDSFGLSSSGSRPKLVSMTCKTLVDQGVPQQCIQLLPFIPCILTTLGKEGVLMTELLRPGDHRLSSPDSAPYILSRSLSEKPSVGGVYMRLFPSVHNVPTDEIVSVNGIGDTFLGVIVAGLAKENPKQLTELVNVAQQASVLTLRSSEAVSPVIESLKDAL